MKFVLDKRELSAIIIHALNVARQVRQAALNGVEVSALCESAGIGRQARLRGVCQPTWEFKSPLSHQKKVDSFDMRVSETINLFLFAKMLAAQGFSAKPSPHKSAEKSLKSRASEVRYRLRKSFFCLFDCGIPAFKRSVGRRHRQRQRRVSCLCALPLTLLLLRGRCQRR